MIKHLDPDMKAFLRFPEVGTEKRSSQVTGLLNFVHSALPNFVFVCMYLNNKMLCPKVSHLCCCCRCSRNNFKLKEKVGNIIQHFTGLSVCFPTLEVVVMVVEDVTVPA